MKKWVVLLVMLLCLAGCGKKNRELERGLSLRARVLQAEGCTFSAAVTADYGDKTYSFSMDCQGDREGNLSFTVTAPETVSGITGTVSTQGGTLTFDGTALAFPVLAEGLISPISGPWVLLTALRSGPITAAALDGDRLRLSLDDGYEDTALHLDIWWDGEDRPVLAEIWQDGRTFLTISLEKFTLLSQNEASGHMVG